MKKFLVILSFTLLYSIINVEAYTYYECNKYKVTIGEFHKSISAKEWRELYRDYDVLQCPSNVTYDTANYPEGGECYIKNGSKYDIYYISYQKETYYKPESAETLGDFYCQNGKKHIYSCEAANDNQELCRLMSDECSFSNNSCITKSSNVGDNTYSPITGEIITTTSHHDPIDICESSGFLQAILVFKTLLKFVCLIVPIILIIVITLESYKLISEPSDFKKVFPVVRNKLIMALIILFIPTIVRSTMSLLNKEGNFAECYNNANSEYIEAVREREKKY